MLVAGVESKGGAGEGSEAGEGRPVLVFLCKSLWFLLHSQETPFR
jgi:hypothetical protein